MDFESRDNEGAVLDHPLGGRIVILGEKDVTTYRGKTRIPQTETFLEILIIRNGSKRVVKIRRDQFEGWYRMLGGGSEPDDWKPRGRGREGDWRGHSLTTTSEERKQRRDITHEDDPERNYLTSTTGGIKHECPEDDCSFSTWSANGMNTHVRAIHR